MEKVKDIAQHFTRFEPNPIPRGENERVDMLSRLGSSTKLGGNWTLIHETLEQPSIVIADHQIMFAIYMTATCR